MKQIALITGSSRGIGKEIARELIESGFQVVLHASKMSNELKDTELEFKKLDPKTRSVVFDVSDGPLVEKSCKDLLASIGRVDVLINNAGIARDKTLLNMSDEDWDSVIKINLYGPFFVTKNVLPAMIKNNYGRIINVSSIAAQRGAFGKTNYAAAKAGLIGFTKSLALETGKYNVTVNAICPGLIDTEMSRSIPEKYVQKAIEQIALKRVGRTEEIASLVAFVASEKSSYITGSVIDVNGGWP